MLRSVGSNWVLLVASTLATYVLTPFVITTVGPERYGTWTLITALTGYLSLLALGVPMASVRYLAQYVSSGDHAQVNRVVGSCTALYLVIGLVALVVGAAMTAGFVAIYDLPPALSGEARAASALMVLCIAVSFIGILPEGILFAHHDFVPRNLIRIAGVLLRLALTVGLLAAGASITALAAVQLACLVFDFGVCWLVIRRRYPLVRFNPADADWSTLRQIFSFSVYVLLLNAAARLIFETDAIVIGAFLGVAAIPYYAVANSLMVYLMESVIAIAAVVSPTATRLHTQGRTDELREIFLKWSKVALSLSLLATLFLVVFGGRFIGWWIGPDFEGPSGRVLQILMLSSLIFLPVRGVALPVLIGLGRPKVPTAAFLAAGVLNVVLSIALIGPFGLAGVAVGTAIPNVLAALIVLAAACRELSITPATYLMYVVPRAVLGGLPILGLLLWFKFGLGIESIAGLVAAGSTMVVLFGLLWVFFVYRDDPYVDLKPHLLRFRLAAARE